MFAYHLMLFSFYLLSFIGSKLYLLGIIFSEWVVSVSLTCRRAAEIVCLIAISPSRNKRWKISFKIAMNFAHEFFLLYRKKVQKGVYSA